MVEGRPNKGADDLDALLDDALEGFDVVRGLPESDTKKAEAPLPQASTSSNVPEGQSRPKKLAFDPLARRPVKQSLEPTPPAAVPASTEDLNSLSDGLSKLLAELAGAAGREEDIGNATATGNAADPPGSLAATLRALADQQPQFPEGEGGDEDAMLENLMAQFSALGGGGGGGGSSGIDPALLAALGGMPPGGIPGLQGGDDDDEAGMSSLVDVIMQQLLSKDVLYQPMKDIGAKYPEWLDAHRDTLSTEDMKRYEEQRGYIVQICELYETDPTNYAKLMELLQEMQQRGQPPQEIVDELAPGMSFGADGLPNFGGGDGGLGMPGGLGNPGDCAQQ